MLTADKLQARNWPCNPVCSLCSNHPETATDLCLHCPFAVEVWGMVSNWSDGLMSVPTQGISIEDRWCKATTQQPKAGEKEDGSPANVHSLESVEGEDGAASHQGGSAVTHLGLWCPACILVSMLSRTKSLEFNYLLYNHNIVRLWYSPLLI
jgi:hypothetical protein